MAVGLVIERIRLTGPWSDWAWMPAQVLLDVPETPAWAILSHSDDRTRYYAGTFVIELHPSSTGYYRDNLASERPVLWVAMQPAGWEPPMESIAVTVDPTEGEGYTQTGTMVVETLPLPAEIAATVAAFISEHHVERVFEKRQRDKSRPRMGDGRNPGPGQRK